MFNEVVKNVLVAKFLGVLTENKAGREADRPALAQELALTAEEYLNQVFRTAPLDQRDTGIHQTKDIVEDEDYAR